MTAARAARFDGQDFDRVTRWATANLKALVQRYAGLELSSSGRGPCPLHGGNNPEAFNVSASGWHCFTGCNTGGDGVDFVRRVAFGALSEREGRVAAIRDLAPDAGVHLEAPRGYVAPVRSAYVPPVRMLEPVVKSWQEENRERIARTLEEMAANGQAPSAVGEVLSVAHSAMALGEQGCAYLESRGLHVAAARAFGFRSLESPADWHAVAGILGSSFTHAECERAGLWRLPVQVPFGDGTKQDATPALVLPYHDVQRNVIGWRLRELVPGAFGVKANGDPRRYHSLAGTALAWPFNAPDLANIAGEELHVAEGELNAFALACHGVRAIGLDGAGKWRAEWTPLLRPVGRLVAWYDNDKAGGAGLRKLATHLAEQFGTSWVQAHGRTSTLHGADVNDTHRTGQLAAIVKQAAWRD